MTLISLGLVTSWISSVQVCQPRYKPHGSTFSDISSIDGTGLASPVNEGYANSDTASASVYYASGIPVQYYASGTPQV